MKKKKDPLDKMVNRLSKMTPEQTDDLMKKIKTDIEAGEKDEEDRQAMRGKHAPPEGACVVCSEKVVAKVTTRYYGDPMHMILGPGSQNQMTTRNEGWHCTGCGLRYEFPPKGPPTV